MSSYFLSPHVHLGITAEAVVFLDLRTSRYLGLDASCVDAVRRLIDGATREDVVERQLVDRLVDRGLITTDQKEGKALRPAVLPAAQSALVGYEPGPEHSAAERCKLHHVLNLMVAVVRARVMLKLVPLRRTVENVAVRKARALEMQAEMDIESARQLVGMFQYLRPFFYSAQTRCLVDTLTLIEFLARYGIYPEWVFGIQTRPFEAHTWLQHAGLAFNDQPSRTRLYAPILVI